MCKIEIEEHVGESMKRIPHESENIMTKESYDLPHACDNRIILSSRIIDHSHPIFFGFELWRVLTRTTTNQSHASRHLSRRRGHFIPVRWNFSSRRHLDQYLRSRDWGPRHSTFRDHMRTRPRTPRRLTRARHGDTLGSRESGLCGTSFVPVSSYSIN